MPVPHGFAERSIASVYACATRRRDCAEDQKCPATNLAAASDLHAVRKSYNFRGQQWSGQDGWHSRADLRNIDLPNT